MEQREKNLLGIGFVVLGMLIFSLQDVAVKRFSGQYPILEIVLFRSLTALPVTLLFFRGEGRHGLPTTRRPLLEIIRGGFYFLSFTTYMMGVAALPLGDMAAIRNSAPLMITLLSAMFLGEGISLPRWLGLLTGFVGVLLIVQPGTATFNLGSVFALIATLFYALNVILTRKLHRTDSSATMAFYSSLVYLGASFLLAPLSMLVGEVPDAHPSIAFLFAPWRIPSPLDLLIMLGLGLVWAAGMYCIARAYSLGQAPVVAPFEYSSLPINILWGMLLWHHLPTAIMLSGATLTLLSGLYLIYRERRESMLKVETKP
ncbi:DMT family transporter [Anaerolinea sp.]|uniref:DMT family transporter n=1 Tax=Anaerolinea sp. TaxID=1872519 RepID=UPI002ACE9593|nr:DMT family transporter [Anaerolinea sp.]